MKTSVGILKYEKGMGKEIKVDLNAVFSKALDIE